MLEGIALGRSAEEESAVAARFDERDELALFADSLRQLQIAADFAGAAIGDMKAAGGRLFDDQPVEQLLRNGLRPFGEQFAFMVEVDDLKVAGDLAADQTDRVVRIGEPGRDFNRSRQPFLPGLPLAHKRALPGLDGGKHGQSGGKVAFRGFDGYAHILPCLTSSLFFQSGALRSSGGHGTNTQPSASSPLK